MSQVGGKVLFRCFRLELAMEYKASAQGFKVCDAKGGDCIEENSAKTFNCRKSCIGVYADVHWVGNQVEEEKSLKEAAGVVEEDQEDVPEVSAKILKRLAELEREVKLLKSNFGENGESVKWEETKTEKWNETHKETSKRLVAEYRKFKEKIVRHFRFSTTLGSSEFSKYRYFVFAKFIQDCIGRIF